MRDVSVLKERVERAERQLRATHAARERECDTLMETWERVRQRYEVQEADIAHYRARVEALQRANDELSILVDALLASVSSNLHEASSEAVPRITELARGLLATEPVARVAEPDDPGGADGAPTADDEPLVLTTVAEDEAPDPDEAPAAAAEPSEPARPIRAKAAAPRQAAAAAAAAAESAGVRNLLSRLEAAHGRRPAPGEGGGAPSATARLPALAALEDGDDADALERLRDEIDGLRARIAVNG